MLLGPSTRAFADEIIPLDPDDPILKVRDAQSCSVDGLDPSPASSQGGVHCLPGDLPFSLAGILNGTIPLYVGNSTTPSWNIINDTGATVTSLTLWFSGQLASNAFIDLQQGNDIFTACETTEFGGSPNYDANCGTGDIADDPVDLPLKMVWSGGSGLAVNQVFNLGTASFAHAGEDAGCISGTSDCSAVPEPTSLVLLGSGFVALSALARRRRHNHTGNNG
jgi:hypothetical protein